MRNTQTAATHVLRCLALLSMVSSLGCGSDEVDLAAAPEVCDGIDNDFDDVVDNAVGNLCEVGKTCVDGACVIDLCPDDPEKSDPGECGCGRLDTDADSDGTADCNDACPDDSEKVETGQCGCGQDDSDSDEDDTADCNDECPDDANKAEPGVCGCGEDDSDSDEDGTADCNDECPDDAEKANPGACGCGVADTDSDEDGTADCNDECPDDANKTDSGVCGCGVGDTDSDNDGTPNCNDGCPNNPLKVAPGVCGCAVADTDTDNDGTLNCDDQCPNNAPKVAPGICGCAVADTDSDNDGTPNCNDQCPNDPAWVAVSACGACAALPVEVCDGADNDCDGVTDNPELNLCAAGLSCTQSACAPPGYVRIAPGVFTMGSPAGELGRLDVEVQHQVTITRAFWIKTTEVTQAEWLAVMGRNPSYFVLGGGGAACGANCPVERVSWNDAVDYVNRISDTAGLARCYDANRAFAGLGCLGYRLPTEAEWEFAARAGTQTAFHTGVNTQLGCNNDPNLSLAGWYCGNAAGTTHPVGLKQANAWGLYDMHGNVMEWVQDWNAAYSAGAAADPLGPAAGTFRVYRGGTWSIDARYARSAFRDFNDPDGRYNDVGFRPARSLP